MNNRIVGRIYIVLGFTHPRLSLLGKAVTNQKLGEQKQAAAEHNDLDYLVKSQRICAGFENEEGNRYCKGLLIGIL